MKITASRQPYNLATLKPYNRTTLGKVSKKHIGEKSGLLPNPPRTPPVWSFSRRRKLTPIFFLEIRPLLGETNFTLGPISKSILFIILLFFDTGLLSPRIWGAWATFKAVLTAVDMKQALQTKCKTCFEGPRMILDTL